MNEQLINQIREDIDRFTDLIEGTDDPEVKDRYFQALRKKTRELKELKEGDEQAIKAIDTLENAIENLVRGNLEIAKSKLDIQKLNLKLGFLNANQPEV